VTRSIAPARFWQERLFVLALLLALASALIPALFPVGASMGRSVGSAFDPTTSTVTLRGREQTAEPVIIAEPDGDRTQAPQITFDGPARPPVETPVAAARTIRARPALPAAPTPTPYRVPQAQPRAPPLSHLL
jgi:hypothetical protein